MVMASFTSRQQWHWVHFMGQLKWLVVNGALSSLTGWRDESGLQGAEKGGMGDRAAHYSSALARCRCVTETQKNSGLNKEEVYYCLSEKPELVWWLLCRALGTQWLFVPHAFPGLTARSIPLGPVAGMLMRSCVMPLKGACLGWQNVSLM